MSSCRRCTKQCKNTWELCEHSFQNFKLVVDSKMYFNFGFCEMLYNCKLNVESFYVPTTSYIHEKTRSKEIQISPPFIICGHQF